VPCKPFTYLLRTFIILRYQPMLMMTMISSSSSSKMTSHRRRRMTSKPRLLSTTTMTCLNDTTASTTTTTTTTSTTTTWSRHDEQRRCTTDRVTRPTQGQVERTRTGSLEYRGLTSRSPRTRTRTRHDEMMYHVTTRSRQISEHSLLTQSATLNHRHTRSDFYYLLSI